MKRILIALTLVGAFTFPASAGAIDLQTSDASQPWQSWADSMQVPSWQGTLPLTVSTSGLACGGFSDAIGCTSVTPQVDQTTGAIIQGAPATISTEIDTDADSWAARATLYHELGQVFWAEYMTPAAETQFMQIVGLAGDSSRWWDWNQVRWVNGVRITFAPYEWFAEGYRYCAEYGINQPKVNDEEGLGYPGDRASFAAQQRQVCALIDQVGSDNGIPTPAQRALPARARRVQRPRLFLRAAHRWWR